MPKWNQANNTQLRNHTAHSYADVVVHRLLGTLLGLSPLPDSVRDREALRGCADNLNVRHRNAQMAGRASVELHTLIFFRGRDVVADARVTKVRVRVCLLCVCACEGGARERGAAHTHFLQGARRRRGRARHKGARLHLIVCVCVGGAGGR